MGDDVTLKTGALNGAWVELEHPKPPPVANHYDYWAEPPPERSARCDYWLRQIERGFRRNRKLRAECYDCSAEWFGVWIWEWTEVLWPAFVAAERNEAAILDRALDRGDQRAHTATSTPKEKT